MVQPRQRTGARHAPLTTGKSQKFSLNENSITRGDPSANTPEPSPRRLLLGCSPEVPFREPGTVFPIVPSAPLNGFPGPSKLEKFITLKKDTPGCTSTFSRIL